jgi:hypothetical protein
MPCLLALIVDGFYGWHGSAFNLRWIIPAHLLVILLAVILIWGNRLLLKILRMGPRSVASMFVLSMIVTLAVTASSVLGLMIMLITSKLLVIFEMRTAAFNEFRTLFTLTLISFLGINIGWGIGYFAYPSSSFWL